MEIKEHVLTATLTGDQIRLIGKHLMSGGLDALLGALFFLIVFLVAINIVRLYAGIGMDSTDKSKWSRSGLSVFTDNATGVQYLSDGKGGMIVRKDRFGNIYSDKSEN